MFKVLIKKELLQNLFNQRYVSALILLSALIGLSTWSMEKHQRTLLSNYSSAMVGYQDEALSSEQFWQFLSAGLTREKKPGSLALLANGLDADMNRALTFAEWNPVEVGPRKISNPLFLLFTPPDFVYIINIVGSLLALLFVYDAVCGEKEDGTLRLMLTTPVPKDIILLAKWCAGILSLGIPLFCACFAAWIYLYFAPGFEISGEHTLRLLLMFGLSLCFLSTFFTLGLWVSCLTHRSSTSLMVCLFLWIILVLAIPNIMPMIARTLRPVPAEGKIAIEKEHKKKEIEETVGNRLRNEIHDPDEWNQAVKRIVARELQGIDQFRRNRVEEQVSLAQNLSRISPASCFTFAAYEVANTGIHNFQRFQRYAFLYRQQFNQTKNQVIDDFKERGEADGNHWDDMPMQIADYHRFPLFRPVTTTLNQTIQYTLFDFGLLLAFNVVLFLGAYASFLTYDAK